MADILSCAFNNWQQQNITWKDEVSFCDLTKSFFFTYFFCARTCAVATSVLPHQRRQVAHFAHEGDPQVGRGVVSGHLVGGVVLGSRHLSFNL